MDRRKGSQQKDIIFWGATGMAKVLRECLLSSNLKLVALFDNNRNLKSPFKDVPLYFAREGFESWIQTKSNSFDNLYFLVAIGGDKGKDRIEIQEYLESWDLQAGIAQHSTAFVANDVQLSAGCQILAQSSLCVEVTLGRSCIINTGATVDHECHLGDGVFIAPGVHLAGSVEVEDYATIYTGAIVLPRLKIGEGSIVGAGAVVTKDIPPYTVVVGNPARTIRKINSSE